MSEDKVVDMPSKDKREIVAEAITDFKSKTGCSLVMVAVVWEYDDTDTVSVTGGWGEYYGPLSTLGDIVQNMHDRTIDALTGGVTYK